MRAFVPALAFVALASVALSERADAGDAAPAATPAPPVAKLGAPKRMIGAAWRSLGATTNGCTEQQLHYDYWPDGGIRNFYCHAVSTLALDAVVRASGHAPFLRGPHVQLPDTQGGDAPAGEKTVKLALHDPRDFGRYNPAFVQWLVDNAVPAADDETLRNETQQVYEKFVRQLARVYFVVHQRFEAKPAWKKKQRNEYMRVMDEKNPDWGRYYDKYSTFLGESDSNWGGYDPNLQSAAVAWWLRRDVDKTAPLFLQGLEKLLRTYDRAWLDAQQKH